MDIAAAHTGEVIFNGFEVLSEQIVERNERIAFWQKGELKVPTR